jgi:tetratricopeptide (TPR) repeat protein
VDLNLPKPKTNYMKRLQHSTMVLGCLLMLGGNLVATTGCNTAASEPNNTVSANTLEIPALKERKGELAKIPEWEKTKEKVVELTQQIAGNQADVKPRLKLATIYMAEARITGEHPYYYPAILRILDGVLTIEPQNFEGLVLKSSVKMSQHQFAEARALATRAQSINPNNAYVYGVLVDANVELGNYKEAVAMSDKMQALKPSLEAYSRASYLREINGDYDGAIEAMTLAAQAGLPGSEPQSWSQNTLAYLYEKTGQLDKAAAEYEAILQRRPSYAFAIKGLADVCVAKKDYQKALSLLNEATKVMPEFSFYEKMGDIYALQGDKAKASQTFKDVITMLKEDEASGHSVNLELARIYEKLEDYKAAHRYAMLEYEVRPSNIDVNQALAWISFKTKNIPAAQKYMTAAFATGSKDPELLWKASEIEKSAGNTQAAATLLAKAKQVNTSFDPAIAAH